MCCTEDKLTVCEVRWVKAVVHEDTVWFGHFQVDNIRGVFQGSDGMLVGHLFQASIVHLKMERKPNVDIKEAVIRLLLIQKD